MKLAWKLLDLPTHWAAYFTDNDLSDLTSYDIGDIQALIEDLNAEGYSFDDVEIGEGELSRYSFMRVES